MKTDVVLLPGMHGSTALYDAFVALAPAWARCVPVALPTLGDQSISGLTGTLEARLAAAFTATADEIAPLLAAPLLAILGTKDRLVSPAKTRALLKGVPFATVVDLDAPHLVVQTKPAEVWAAISGEFESAA